MKRVVGYLLRQTHSGETPPCRHFLRCEFTGWENPRVYFADQYDQRTAFRLTRREAHRLAKGYREQGHVVVVVRLVRTVETPLPTQAE